MKGLALVAKMKDKRLSAIISTSNEWIILIMSMSECIYLINHNPDLEYAGELKFCTLVMIIPMMLLNALC